MLLLIPEEQWGDAVEEEVIAEEEEEELSAAAAEPWAGAGGKTITESERVVELGRPLRERRKMRMVSPGRKTDIFRV